MTLDRDDTFDLPPDYEAPEESRNKGVHPNALTVAMLSPEEDVEMPGMRQPASMVSNLIALGVGENYTKSLLVDETVTMATLQDQLNTWKYKLRQSVNQAVRRARDFDNRTLSMETTQTITSSGRIYVQVIVTRLD